MRSPVLALLLLSTSAVAQNGGEPRERVVLAVGDTTSREVGWAMGSTCDDTTIVEAEMRNKDPETNVLVLRGRKAGTTLCRAGTYQIENRPTYLFEIVVVERARR